MSNKPTGCSGVVTGCFTIILLILAVPFGVGFLFGGLPSANDERTVRFINKFDANPGPSFKRPPEEKPVPGEEINRAF